MYTYTTRGEAKAPPKHTGRHGNPSEDASSKLGQPESVHGAQQQQKDSQNGEESKKAQEPERGQKAGAGSKTEDGKGTQTGQPDEERNESGEKHDKEKDGALKVPIVRISYTNISLFLHLYIAWFHLSTLVRYPPWRIENFAHFVFSISGLYHIFSLLSSFLMPALHRIIVAHGTWLVNAALWYPIFLTTRWPNAVAKECNDFRQQGSLGENILLPVTSEIDAIPYCGFATNLGTFPALFLPLISWLVYLVFLRRRSVSLIIWEQESRYVALRARWKRILTEEEMYEKELVGIPEEGVMYAPGRGISVGWIYRLGHLLSPGLLIYSWRWWLTGEGSLPSFASPAADMSEPPGLLSILAVSFWANLWLWIWVSMNGFQYRGVVWKQDLKEGAAVWVNGDGVLVGGWVR